MITNLRQIYDWKERKQLDDICRQVANDIKNYFMWCFGRCGYSDEEYHEFCGAMDAYYFCGLISNKMYNILRNWALNKVSARRGGGGGNE